MIVPVSNESGHILFIYTRIANASNTRASSEFAVLNRSGTLVVVNEPVFIFRYGRILASRALTSIDNRNLYAPPASTREIPVAPRVFIDYRRPLFARRTPRAVYERTTRRNIRKLFRSEKYGGKTSARCTRCVQSNRDRLLVRESADYFYDGPRGNPRDNRFSVIGRGDVIRAPFDETPQT